MAENSKIEWTHHTFNPWVGCTKVSPACDHCYAEAWAKRTGQPGLWAGQRRRTTPQNWHRPVLWNRMAESSGTRYRVFCASLADVFDNEVPDEWRADLFDLILATPHLDWLLLTKRIGNAAKMLPTEWEEDEQYPTNVWLGITVVSQAEADRDIPKLLEVPAAVRWLSCEPLLGPIDLSCEPQFPPLYGRRWIRKCWPVDWIVVGGESGPRARPLDVDWCTSIRAQCAAAGVSFFMKQGSAANWPSFKDFSSFPSALQLREYPA